MNKILKTLICLSLAFFGGGLFAAPISAEQARKAVTKWVAARPAAHMEADFVSDEIRDVESVAGQDGKDIFHVVTLREGGYVITSADDRITPIVAFSDEGVFEKSDENPLWALLNDDLPRRPKDADAANGQLKAAPSVTVAEWEDLLSDEDDLDRGASSISDVRVAALLSSKWDQTTNSKGQNCYNYHTPNNYYCGCVATAGSQLMRFHQWPTSSVTPQTRTCYVNGYSSTRTMKGGTYAWSNMPLVPDNVTLSSTQQDAIGKLCYDVGVAVEMNWTSSGSGADTCDLADAFTGVFGYANAKRRYTGSSSITFTDAEMKRGIYANLDAGYPVCLGIRGSAGGHAIVADGYGYYNGSIYTHLNLGWSGSYNVWYALPRIDAGYDFTVVYRLVYNVFPNETGELLTGRVLNSAGQPISGASVVAANGSDRTDRRETSTNAKGIFAFKVQGGQSWTISVSASGYESKSLSVTVPTSTTSAIGNSWGNDFSLSVASSRKPNLHVDHAFLSNEDGEYDEVDEEVEFAKGETIYLYMGFGSNGEQDAPAPFNVKHELLNSSGTVLSTWTHTQEDDITTGWMVHWEGYAWPAIQNLGVGRYTYRVTIDPENAVSESSETDNTKSVAFTVSQAESPLTTVSISGASSVLPGSRTTYTGRAYLADGTVVDADCVWTLDSGSSYATIGSATGVLAAGVPTSPVSVVIRATCTYNGSVKSATKVVSIQAAVSLATALDNTRLSFVTDGDAPWYGQTQKSYDGMDAARSGAVGNYQKSWMETTVTGPGTLSFRYLVSSEQNYDKFTFTHNGNVVHTESGIHTSWAQYAIEVPSGSHTFRWQYEKDVSLSSGDDAVYVDQVQWSTVATLSSIEIRGASEVNAGGTAQMSCIATMSDSTTKGVTPTWSIFTGSQYASISSTGLLNAFASIDDRTVVLHAEYTEGGIEKTASKIIGIKGVLPLPDTPVILSAGAGSSDSANITWGAAANASSYNVYRSTDNMRPTNPLASGLTVRRYSDSTAEPGVAYNYWVAAVNATGVRVSEMAAAHRLAALSVDAENLKFDYGQATRTLSVRANVEWTYSKDCNWITLSHSGDNLIVEASANDESENPRSAKILLVTSKNLDFPLTVEIFVNQDGKPQEDPGALDFAFVTTESCEGGYSLYTTVSEDGGLARLFDVKSDIHLCWGWGNVGTADFDGGLATEIDIRDSSASSVYGDWVYDDLVLKSGDSVDSTFTSSEWSKFEPGVYTATVRIDPENEYEELQKENNVAEFRFAVRDSVSLAEALDCTVLNFATTDESWYGTAGIGEDGTDCAMTQLLGDNGVNELSSSVSGAGTLTFKYRVSSEASYDVFTFKIDGQLKFSDSGEGEWRVVTYELGEGEHSFNWTYSKDSEVSVGDDCVYLDQVVWKAKRTDEPPENLVASDGTYYGYVRLSWREVDDAVTYVIERSESVDGEWTVAYDGAHVEYAYDKDALGGVDYLYRIKAVFADGESKWSETPESGWRKAEITQPSSRTVPGVGGSEGVTMKANCAWKVTSDSSWLTIDEEEGVGDFKLVYRFERNTTGSERKANITVYTAPGTSRETSRSFAITQKVPVNVGDEIPLAEAANCELAFQTSAESPWIGQTSISHDGRHSMRSGEITGNATSRVETVFANGGTLSFWWGTSSDSYDRLSLYVGGVLKKQISGYNGSEPKNWEQITIDIPEGGATVGWEYVKDGSGDRGADAAFIDEIVWEPTVRQIQPDDEWWNEHLAVLVALELNWDQRALAAAMQSPGSEGRGGKVYADGTPVHVWEDYVAGTDPLDSDSHFTATIEFADGVPVIGWSPMLSAEKTALRNYIIFGKRELKSDKWEPIAEGREADYNFFKVSVELK